MGMINLKEYKKEIVGLVIILIGIYFYSYWNYLVSLEKARDIQRRNDLTAVQSALEAFYNDFDRYPLASDEGEIIACLPEGWEREDMKYLLAGRPLENREKMFQTFAPCIWGESVFEDFTVEGKEPYLSHVPQDMESSKGRSYRYFSTGDHYQIFGSFEGKSVLDYSTKIEQRNISCGSDICNFGKASRGTPLDMSLKEYENKLMP